MNLSAITGTFSGSQPNPVADATRGDMRATLARSASDATSVQTRQAPAQASAIPPAREEVEKAVQELNDFLKPLNNTLTFNIDEDTGASVVKVIDSATDEVIRQVPSEEVLSIAKALDKMKGLLVQQKA